MKKISFLFLMICFVMSAFAQQNIQSIAYEGLIAKAISQEEFNKLKAEAPSKLADLYLDLTHFCYVSDQVPAGSRNLGDYCDYVSPGQTCDNAASIVSSRQFNHRKYASPTDEVVYNVLNIGNTGYYVVILPTPERTKKIREGMKKFGF